MSNRGEVDMSVSEDMQDGHCCQYCGVWNDDLLEAGKDWNEGDSPIVWASPGFPWTCENCADDEQ